MASSSLAQPVKVAIAPLRDTADAAAIERALVDAAQASPLQVVNAAGARLSGRGASSEPAQKARELAHETGAARVLLVEAARLGDGRVLYLQGLDASGAAIGSTTVPIQHESGEVIAADRPAVRAAMVRAVAPARYLGKLKLHVDVPNAVVQIDGRPQSSAGELELPVGTHALRVTHPAYRDFLRFVDVEYDKVLPIDVALSAYPLAEGEMTERLRKQAGKRPKVPWWRSWWALSVTGVVLTGVTAGIVIGARPGVTADHSSSYTAPPVP